MKKTLLATAFVASASLFTVNSGLAEEGMYVTALAGMHYGDTVDGTNNIENFTGYGNETGESYSIGLGYRVDKNFRLEVRMTRRDNSSSNTDMGFSSMAGMDVTGTIDGELTSDAVTVEMFYDFDVENMFTPYMKAGLGHVKNDYSASLFIGELGVGFDYEEGDNSGFIWLVGAGCSFDLGQSLDLVVEYQYANLGEVRTATDLYGDNIGNDNYGVHEINIGLKYSF